MIQMRWPRVAPAPCAAGTSGRTRPRATARFRTTGHETRAGHGKGMEAGKSPCRWCLYYIAGIVILLFSDEWDGVGRMAAGVGAAEEARGVAHAPH